MYRKALGLSCELGDLVAEGRALDCIRDEADGTAAAEGNLHCPASGK